MQRKFNDDIYRITAHIYTTFVNVKVKSKKARATALAFLSILKIEIYRTVQFFFTFNIIIIYFGRIKQNCFI